MKIQDKVALPRVEEAERLFALDKPSMRALSYILRRKELWPQGFWWDYSDCEHCAMGLAAELWREVKHPSHHHLARVFKIPAAALADIFTDPWTYDCDWDDVTPEKVADMIDDYLA